MNSFKMNVCAHVTPWKPRGVSVDGAIVTQDKRDVQDFFVTECNR